MVKKLREKKFYYSRLEHKWFLLCLQIWLVSKNRKKKQIKPAKNKWMKDVGTWRRMIGAIVFECEPTRSSVDIERKWKSTSEWMKHKNTTPFFRYI